MNFRRLVVGKYSLLVVAWALVSGCEAPLDLSGIEAQKAEIIRRFDHFKSATSIGDQLVVVGDHGAVLTSYDRGATWHRLELTGNPALVDVTACPGGRVVALDRARKVWIADSVTDSAESWIPRDINTEETPLAITCDSEGQLWITASFSTILSSSDQGKNWQSVSQDEDMQFGTIQFVSDDFAVVTGEFGAFYVSRDGGHSWERGEDLPDEFFPLAAYFSDSKKGWVAGLNGTILHTVDSGVSWRRQSTTTKSPLYSLTGKAGQVYVAGDSGALLRLVDQAWVDVKQTHRARSYNIAMAMLGDDQLLIAGGSGNLGVISVPVEAPLMGSVGMGSVGTAGQGETESGAQL